MAPDGPPGEKEDRIVPFPQSRAPGRRKNNPVKNLGTTRLELQLDAEDAGRAAIGAARAGVRHG
jgi:hypothetical protein